MLLWGNYREDPLGIKPTTLRTGYTHAGHFTIVGGIPNGLVGLHPHFLQSTNHFGLKCPSRMTEIVVVLEDNVQLKIQLYMWILL